MVARKLSRCGISGGVESAGRPMITAARLASQCRRRYAGPVLDSKVNSGDRPLPPGYSEDGVDLTLIRWMLSLTPRERLEFLEDRINDILAIRERNAGR